MSTLCVKLVPPTIWLRVSRAILQAADSVNIGAIGPMSADGVEPGS